MKKICFVLFVSSIAFSQQFPVGSYRVLSDYTFNPLIAMQAHTIFPMCKDAYFTMSFCLTKALPYKECERKARNNQRSLR